MEQKERLSTYDLVVIGANGGIGRQAVELALQTGHRVTAILRNPANLQMDDPNLNIVKGDIMQPATYIDFLRGKDAVISAIGARDLKPTTIYSSGNGHLLDAMKRAGVRRVFFISASALDISPVIPFAMRLLAKYVLQKILRNMYDDLRAMEALVKESGVDWTIMRPPRLVNKPVTGHYRWAANSFLKNSLSISRADVADFMMKNLQNEQIYKATVEIGY